MGNEKHELKNRYLHLNWNVKVDIGGLNVSTTMIKNINNLYDELSGLDYFGRGDVIGVLKLSPSGAYKLIKNCWRSG